MRRPFPNAKDLLTKIRFTRMLLMTTFATLTASIVFVALALPASAIGGDPRGSIPLSIGVRSDPPTTTTSTTTTPVTTTTIQKIQYPDGVSDASEPSGESPPTTDALPGYRQSYVDDFGNSSSLAGWTIFQGPTTGDPGGQFAKTHVTMGSGLLQLNSWQDPSYGNTWATGGVCQCSVNRTYGAYFVRSRLTGPGPTVVEMLMPQVGWPPEIDFNETRQSDGNTIATLHHTSADLQIYRQLYIDETQWHTWGVIWTPTSITYTVDGHAWGSITEPSVVPDQPMHLDLTQQTWCSSGFACPNTPQSTEIDWVAEYTPTTAKAASVAQFAANSVKLPFSSKAKIVKLAQEIKNHGNTKVALIGYDDNSGTVAKRLALSRARAGVVETYLRRQLATLGVTGVNMTTIAKGASQPAASNATPSGRAKNRRVVLWIT